MYHPWQRFKAEAQWTLQTARLPRGRKGQIDWQTHTIVIDRGLLQTERRCTITHELVHIERGPVPSDPWLKHREEQAVEAEAARRLITLEALADALAWSSQPAEVAEELWVDTQTLAVRISGLNDIERTWLNHRLEIDQ